MARKIELRNGLVKVNGGDTEAPFSWAEMMQAILKFAPPNKGLVLDDVLKAVEAMKPLDQAMADHADHVTFSEDQYKTLTERLDQFPFGVADPAIAEFGLAVRNAKEIT
jgi:hypothetical protein